MNSFFVVLATAVLSQTAFAGFQAGDVPECLDNQGKVLPIDNQNVLRLETSTANQYATQAHVSGPITAIYPDHSGHHHFAIQLGDTPHQGLEVVYNEDFGAVPEIKVGMTVEACGTYITSNAATSQYPASPMGAIIHWVHINPNPQSEKHPSGFLMFDGQVCGQDTGGSNNNSHHGGKKGFSQASDQSLNWLQ